MLGAATDLYEQLFESSPIPRTVVDASGKVVFMNTAFRKLTGNRIKNQNDSTLGNFVEHLLASPEYLEVILHPFRNSITTNYQGKVVFQPENGVRIKVDFVANYFVAGDQGFYSYEWTDVTEKIAARKALKSASERLELATHIHNLGVWEYEFESKNWFLNNYMYEIFGIQQEAFEPHPEAFNRFFDPNDLKKIYELWEKAESGDSRLMIEASIFHPDKGKRKLFITGKCLFDSLGKPWRFIGTIEDVTEKKLQQEEILLEKSRLKSLIDSQSNFFIRLDTEGKITFCNHSFRQKFSSQNTCTGEYALSDFVLPDNISPLKLVLDTCMAHPGEIFLHRSKASSAEGQQVIVDWEFIANIESGVTEIQGFGRDITERILLSDQVREALENIKSTINNFNKVSIWSIDRNYKVIALNDHFKEEFYSYNNNTLEIGDVIIEKVRPEIYNDWKNLYDDVFANGAKQLFYEIDKHFFEVSLNPIQVGNQVTGIAIYGIDITDYRRKEAALLESEARLQFAIEGNNYAVWETNIQNDTVWFSESFSEIFKHPGKQSFSLNGWAEDIHPDDFQNAAETLQKLIEGEIEKFQTEFRMKDGNGDFRWVLNMGKTFEKDEQGKAVRIVGLLSDITARKTAEENMRETMEKLEKFANLTSHSLRKPLANIIGISNLLQEEESLPDSLYELVMEIRKSAHNLDEVVKEMTEAISYGNTVLPASSPIKLKKVWFIDDDEINNMLSMRMMNRVLPESEAQTFLSAEEALNKLVVEKSDKPDSIFLDINMPRMNGWEFLDELAVRGLDIPVYMLTSSIDPRDQDKAGAYEQVKDFISKPLREERLKLLLK